MASIWPSCAPNNGHMYIFGTFFRPFSKVPPALPRCAFSLATVGDPRSLSQKKNRTLPRRGIGSDYQRMVTRTGFEPMNVSLKGI